MQDTVLQYSETAENLTGRDTDIARGVTGLQVPDHHQFSVTKETPLGKQGNLTRNSSLTQGLELIRLCLLWVG